jgi:hypothetical protein
VILQYGHSSVTVVVHEWHLFQVESAGGHHEVAWDVQARHHAILDGLRGNPHLDGAQAGLHHRPSAGQVDGGGGGGADGELGERATLPHQRVFHTAAIRPQEGGGGESSRPPLVGRATVEQGLFLAQGGEGVLRDAIPLLYDAIPLEGREGAGGTGGP